MAFLKNTIRPWVGIIGLCVVFGLSACVSPVADTAASHQAIISPEEQALMVKGDTARTLKRYEEAMAHYGEAMTLSTGATRAHLELAALHRQQGSLNDAAQVLAQAYRINPQSNVVARDYAEILLLQGDTGKAMDVATQAVARNPDDVRLLNVQGVALDRLGDHKAAQARYFRAMERSVTAQEREVTLNNQMLSLVASGDYDTAISAAKSYLPKAQNKPALRQLLALAYGVKGEEDKAYDIGLQDLSIKQVSENLRFYAQLRSGETPVSALFVPAQ